MKNFILAATVLAFAGVSASQAGTSVNTFALQDTTKQDTAKKEYSYEYAVEQDTTKKETPADTAKKEYSYEYAVEQDTTKKETPTDTTKKEKDSYAYAAQYSEQEPDTNQSAPAAQQEERKEVKLEELPDAVKQTLTADIFKEWVPSAAYHVTGGEKEYYHIEVKKGEEIRNIKIGTDGKVVE